MKIIAEKKRLAGANLHVSERYILIFPAQRATGNVKPSQPSRTNLHESQVAVCDVALNLIILGQMFAELLQFLLAVKLCEETRVCARVSREVWF